MFFDGWSGPLRVLAVGVPAYAVLVLLLRVSGKRTLSKMNAFDLVVTVALGSTLATILLSEQVALAEGVTALGLLIVLQFAITWSAYRSERVQRLVKATPRLLYFKDAFIDDAMRRERFTREEVLAAAREQGYASLEPVDAVVLETDGSVTVLSGTDDGSGSTLRGVRRPVSRGRTAAPPGSS